MTDKTFPGAKTSKLRIKCKKPSRMCIALSLRLLISKRNLQKARKRGCGRDGMSREAPCHSFHVFLSLRRSARINACKHPSQTSSDRFVMSQLIIFLCIFWGDFTASRESSTVSQNSRNYHTMRNDDILCAHCGAFAKLLDCFCCLAWWSKKENLLSSLPRRPVKDDAIRAI